MSPGGPPSSGEGCPIGYRLGIVFLDGVAPGITSDQAPFGISVPDFTLFPLGGRYDFPRTLGIPPRGIFCSRYDSYHVQFRFILSDSLHRSLHRSRTAHVEFHLVLRLAWFERNPSRIKCYAFTNDCQSVFRFRVPVFPENQLGRRDGTLGNPQQPSPAQFFHFFFFDDFVFEPFGFTKIFSFLRKFPRIHILCWSISPGSCNVGKSGS
jgi:hypothetical protein